MNLQKVRVENFKSIEDSTEFSIDQVTCLVGKNESGKTALLEALYKLNPVEDDLADFDEEEFPRRHLATYRERKKREPANVLTTKWYLDDNEISILEDKLGPGIVENREVIITKGYDNITRWTFQLNEKEIVHQFIEDANLNAAEKSQLGKPALIRTLSDLINPSNHLPKNRLLF